MFDIKRITVLAVALSATIALTGCGIIQDKVDDAVEDGVEKAIEEGAGDGVDVEFGENADLPAGFPSDVPLPEGSITAAVGADDGFFVTYSVADQGAVDALVAEFESGGWELTGEFDFEGSTQRAYSNGVYDVGIASTPTDTDVQVSISVVPISQ